MNPLAGPCVSVALVLKDEKGIEVGAGRTDAKGEFQFGVDQDGSYSVTPSSRFYEVISPKEKIGRGTSFELKIREKN